MHISHLHFIALEKNSILYRNICVLYINLHILYVDYVPTLEVRMSNNAVHLVIHLTNEVENPWF
jgi:hypothetical protein